MGEEALPRDDLYDLVTDLQVIVHDRLVYGYPYTICASKDGKYQYALTPLDCSLEEVQNNDDLGSIVDINQWQIERTGRNTEDGSLQTKKYWILPDDNGRLTLRVAEVTFPAYRGDTKQMHEAIKRANDGLSQWINPPAASPQDYTELRNIVNEFKKNITAIALMSKLQRLVPGWPGGFISPN